MTVSISFAVCMPCYVLIMFFSLFREWEVYCVEACMRPASKDIRDGSAIKGTFSSA